MLVDIDASSEEGDPGPEPTQIAGNIPDVEWPPFLTDEAITKKSETEAQMMDFKLRCCNNTPRHAGGDLKAYHKRMDTLAS